MAKRERPRLVDLGDGIKVPETIEVRGLVPGYEVSGTATYDDAAGRYRLTSLTVASRETAHGWPEVTGRALRAIRPDEVVQEAARQAVGDALPDVDDRAMWTLDETLHRVAMVYRLAVLVGAAPNEAVVVDFGVPKSTASRWITRARDRGYLTVVDRRGRKAD